MTLPFEEPAKIEMRAACEVAIDQAGHQIVEKRVALAVEDPGVEGRLKGDMQSLDSEGHRYCYYLRPRTGEALPEWLAKLASAAHGVPDIKLYIVVRDASPTF